MTAPAARTWVIRMPAWAATTAATTTRGAVAAGPDGGARAPPGWSFWLRSSSTAAAGGADRADHQGGLQPGGPGGKSLRPHQGGGDALPERGNLAAGEVGVGDLTSAIDRERQGQRELAGRARHRAPAQAEAEPGQQGPQPVH